MAAFAAVLTNEPRQAAITLARRALTAGREALGDRSDRPWYAHATWFSQTTVSLVVAEDYERGGAAAGRVDRQGARDRRQRALRRGAGASRLGVAAPGNPMEAAATPRPHWPPLSCRPPPSIACSTPPSWSTRWSSRASSRRRSGRWRRWTRQPESGSLTAVMLRFARGRLRIAQGRTADGLDDLLAAGAVTTRALVTCPSFLPWRSDAALAQLALGDGDAAPTPRR